MQTFHHSLDAVEASSPSEDAFNRRRRTVGLFLAPAVFLVLLVLPLGTIEPVPHRMAAILGLVVVLWITEALPLAATALLGPILAVLLGVSPVRQALAPFADPTRRITRRATPRAPARPRRSGKAAEAGRNSCDVR